MYVHPTREQMTALTEMDASKPITMLNLLRFADEANPGFGCDGMTGAEAYAEYGRRLGAIGEAFPGSVLWTGTARLTVIGPDDENWDQMVLVEYDSVSAILNMLSNPNYQAASSARDAAVSDSRLILMHASAASDLTAG